MCGSHLSLTPLDLSAYLSGVSCCAPSAPTRPHTCTYSAWLTAVCPSVGERCSQHTPFSVTAAVCGGGGGGAEDGSGDVEATFPGQVLGRLHVSVFFSGGGGKHLCQLLLFARLINRQVELFRGFGQRSP